MLKSAEINCTDSVNFTKEVCFRWSDRLKRHMVLDCDELNQVKIRKDCCIMHDVL